MSTYKFLIFSIYFAVISITGCFAQYKMESVLALVDSEILLGRGIRVELRKGSKLLHPSHASGPDLNVILFGAASFEIFNGWGLILEYNGVIVRATSSIFSIEKGIGTMEITVMKGEVSFLADKQEIVVHRFKRATYNFETKQVTIVDTKIRKT